MPGRLDRFPDFPSGLSGSSMRAWWISVKKAIVGMTIADYSTPSAAIGGMASDGGDPGRVFTVTDDAAVWVRKGVEAVRIGPGAVLAGGLIAFTWTGTGATPAWSPETDIAFNDALDGRLPDVVILMPMVQGGGIARVEPYIVTDGSAEIPDVTAVRARVRCAMDPAPTGAATRACFWLAVALEA